MDRQRRAVLRGLAGFPLVALPDPRRLSGPRPIEVQPLAAQARRLVDALASLGEPFAAEALQPLHAAEDAGD